MGWRRTLFSFTASASGPSRSSAFRWSSSARSEPSIRDASPFDTTLVASYGLERSERRERGEGTVALMLRLAEILLEPRPAPTWAQLRQLGVEEATGVLPRGFVDWRAHAPEQPWEYGPLALYRQQIEDAGLRLTVIEDNPPMDRLRLGLPGREEELETVLELLRTMGRLGIGVWCYNWMAVVPWSRTSVALPGRGGAEVTGFDAAVWEGGPPAPGAPVEEERLWETPCLVPRARRSRRARRRACVWRCTPMIRRCRRYAGSAGSSARSTPTTVSSTSSRARRTG